MPCHGFVHRQLAGGCFSKFLWLAGDDNAKKSKSVKSQVILLLCLLWRPAANDGGRASFFGSFLLSPGAMVPQPAEAKKDGRTDRRTEGRKKEGKRKDDGRKKEGRTMEGRKKDAGGKKEGRTNEGRRKKQGRKKEEGRNEGRRKPEGGREERKKGTINARTEGRAGGGSRKQEGKETSQQLIKE